MELVMTVYGLTKKFPLHERYGLTSQIRRSAVSIPANIAEGAARQTNKEFMQFLHISQGSLSELDTLMELAHGLRYFTHAALDTLDTQMIQIDKMLTGLIRKLRHKSKNASSVNDGQGRTV
ncbi:23Sr RNA gene [hydrothermal vent metagenome]|uniref:23Sr RNA protein n=1 Tax=hydrothermal vent metagenome TaxID=652676 RepID=A0A3B1BKU4_9ZZZZ